MPRLLTLLLAFVLVCVTGSGGRAQAPAVFINEIHYDNTSIDTGEFIEVAGPAGTSLEGYSLVLYNGTGGGVYTTSPLTGIIPDQQNGFGTVAVSYPTDGIQNGPADGIALVQGTTVVQFLSYEGVVTAAGGPAAGMTSTDIGVSETTSTPVGFSLQLQGTGTASSDFTWTGPSPSTPGAVNSGQTFGGASGPTLSIDDVSVAEGNAGTVDAVFTVTVNGAHEGVSFDIATADGSGLSPATVADGDYVARSATAQTIEAGASTYSFAVAINGDTTFERDEQFLVVLGNVTGATVADGEGTGTIVNDDAAPPVTSDVVISQVYGGGGNSGATFTHDFVELFNRGTATVDLTNWSIQYTGATGTSWAVTPLTGSIAPGGYYLIQQAPGSGGTMPLPAPDAAGSVMMAAASGKVALSSTLTPLTSACPASPAVQDLVGYGTATCFEGAAAAPQLGNTTAASRKRGGCFDSNDNATDFLEGSPFPRNSATAARACTFTTLTIDEIQGTAAATPFAGQDVSTTGIVTGRKSNGFFLQAAADSDGDPASSHGLFVFTSAMPAVTVGDVVTARGTAGEFFGMTQIESTLPGDVTVEASGNPLPAPVLLTPALLDPAGAPDQIEHLEGMRVHAPSLTSVAPGAGFGEFFAVLTGVPRPMREPGIDIGLPVPPDPTTGTVDCCIPRFDGNPERIGVDSDGLAGVPPVVVTSNATVTDVVGPLEFAFGSYRVLPDTPLAPSGGMTAVPVRPRAADEFTIAGFNVENFTGDETQRRKAALAIRQVMRYSDVIGLIEIGSLAALEALAQQVNDDALAAGDAGVDYEARLIPAPNPSNTQNVGFLVNTARVQIDAVTQERAAATFINPRTGQPETLHDRPPLVLRATVAIPGRSPRPIIVVVNHLRSFIDVELVDGEGVRVREKRKAQAEDVAMLLQTLQASEPATPVVSIGDYNAYQFNDGYTDPIGTLKGTPTPDEQVVVDASPVLVNPGFVNLTDSLPADQQYTFIFQGTPQALDHVLVNHVAHGIVRDYAIARNNADFPEDPALVADATRPERNSDHDMPVAYFAFPPEADLALTAAGPAAPVVTGSTAGYMLQVANDGPEPATGVVLSVPAVAGLAASIAAPSGWTCIVAPSGAVSCSAERLAAGTSVTLAATVTVGCSVPDAAVLVQQAVLSSGTADVDPSNNEASISLTASNPGPLIGDVIPSVTASPIPGAPRSGAVVGDAALGSPVVTDNCPAPALSREGVPPGNLFPVGETTVTYRAIDSGGASAAAATLVHVLSGVESLAVIRADLQAILASAPRPQLRSRIEAAVRHVDRAIAELNNPAGSHPTAIAATSAAIGDMEDVRRRGLLDASTVRDLLNRMTGVSWVVARQDLEAATETGSPLAILVASALIDQGNAAHAAGQSLVASSLYGAAALVIVLASISASW